MQAIRVNQPGGPEALSYESIDDPSPAADEAVIRIEAIGVNYIDTYQRSGLYPLDPPFTLGMEGAGVVDAVGSNVSGLAAGDRVAHAMHLGSYAELQAVPAAQLIKLPDGIDTRQAAAAMLQGMTAHYLAHSTYPLAAGHTAVVHAGAGGVGRLLSQMAKRAGARVIATAGTPAKAEIAAEAGADDVIIYTEVDFLEEVRRLTDGAGVEVVYDGVGAATYETQFRLPEAARSPGPLRRVQRPGAGAEPTDPQCQGLAIPHPSQPGPLHAHARRVGVARGRCLVLGCGRRAVPHDRPRSRTGRRRRRAHRPPGP